MIGGRDHGRWRADLAAYLLGSLEAEEAEAMEAHLQGCEHCREELRWLRPAVDLLPESVPQREPPPGLKARLMAEVRSDAASEVVPGPRRAARPARRGRFAGLRGLLLRPAVALGAAAVLAAGALGYVIASGGGEQTTTVAARGSEAVRATLEQRGDSGTLQMTGLRELRGSDVYQAWVQRGKRIVPSSLFEPRRDGTASTAIPHQLEGADKVMVSVEPEGGSDQPTSSPIIQIPLD